MKTLARLMMEEIDKVCSETKKAAFGNSATASDVAGWLAARAINDKMVLVAADYAINEGSNE